MVLGIVFTNYNNTHYTIEAVKSIMRAESLVEVCIVIVDNSSDEENVNQLHKLKRLYKNVHIIFCQNNWGYFKGLNIGIKYLRENVTNIEHILIGNNDLIFPDGFLNLFLKILPIFDKYPVISPNIITMDGQHQNPHVINKPGLFREIMYDLYYTHFRIAQLIAWIANVTRKYTRKGDEDYHEIAQTIHQGYGACYILGPVFFEHFQQLWAPTFLMGEEYFLSKQMEDNNLEIYYEPRIIIYHHGHATVNKVPKKLFWKIAKDAHKEYRKHVKVFNFW